MSEADLIAREVVVRGRVQGVFYRDSCRRLALDLGVRGWVANEPDGSVRAWLEGAPAAVDKLLAWMREGPSHARVQAVETSERRPGGAPGFQVR